MLNVGVYGMQPMRYLREWLEKNAKGEHYLFSSYDLKPLFPNHSRSAFKTLLSRAVRSGCLVRVCRGLYAYRKAIPLNGYFLFPYRSIFKTSSFQLHQPRNRSK